MSSLERGPAKETEDNGTEVATDEGESGLAGLVENTDVDGDVSKGCKHGTTWPSKKNKLEEEESLAILGLQETGSRIVAQDLQPPKLRSEDGQDNKIDQPIPPMEADNIASSTDVFNPLLVSSNLDHHSLSLRPASYVDPTPSTPFRSNPPSRSLSSNSADRSMLLATSDASAAAIANAASTAASLGELSPTRSEYDDKRYASDEDEDNGRSRSEIQSIMDQFGEGGGGSNMEVISPRLGIVSSGTVSPTTHPERISSLVTSPGMGSSSKTELVPDDDLGPPVPPKDAPFVTTQSSSHSATAPPQPSVATASIPSTPLSPSTHSLPRPPLPEPEPEPNLPFDFHRFLEQLRNKKADPVARYLKSFLYEFGKRQWMVHEQSKIITDFLHFIAGKMARCDVWSDVPDAEFDNAREGMEKLVMNRLYTQTFSPAIPPPQPLPGAKPRRRGGERLMGPGRRGQHQEDVERDEVVAQKIKIYSWVKEAHLDIPHVGESGRRFLKLAQQELLKIRSYRAPRDKIICVLNCCKVIFGLLKHAKSDSSADSFMPLLIYVVLQASPENLVSNVQYILRFRNQDKLGGEAGYYLSSLLGAIQFIESMDRTALTISDDEFERNVEAAISIFAEKHKLESPTPLQRFAETTNFSLPSSSSHNQQVPEDEASSSRPTHSSASARNPSPAGSSSDEKAPIVGGLLRTIQRPLSSIGRIFSDDPSTQSTTQSTTSPPSQQQLSQSQTPGIWPSSYQQLYHQRSESGDRSVRGRSETTLGPSSAEYRLSAQEAAANQASAEEAEAQRLQRAEHANVVETLASMFPDLDREVISDVVYQKQGRVGLAVDACLALSS